MKTLNLYIAKSLLLTIAIAIGILTFVMLSANLFRAFELLARGVPAMVLVRFLVFLLPDMLTYTIPLGMLCSTVLVFSRMSADNEITAMRASGVSLWQIVSPGLVLSIMLSAGCLWLHTTLGPRCRYRADTLKQTEGMKNPLAAIEPGRFVELPGHVIYVGRREGDRLEDIDIFAYDKNGKVTRDITAREGRIEVDAASRSLKISLNDVTVAEVRPDAGKDQDNVIRLVSETLTLPLDYGEQQDRKPLTRKMKYMDVGMMFGRIYVDQAEGRDTTRHYVELHTRMSMALSPFAFLLLGIPFGIRVQRSETSVGLLLSFILAMGFYVFMLLADSVKNQPALHPEVLVWLPNIVYQAGGLWALSAIAKR